MANFVIKKDGSEELFDAAKIRNSITMAAQRANLSEERTSDVVEQVSRAAMQLAESKEKIATSEIRAKILSELDVVEPSVSEAWRRYDEIKGGA